MRAARRQSKRGVSVYRDNPFWKPTEIQVGKKRIAVAGGTHGGGEILAYSGIHVVEEVNKDQFVKLYTKNMKIFFDIKPSTQKVLMAVIDVVQKSPGCDSIYLNWFTVEDFSEENDLKVSRASFHRAMAELIEKGFLAEAEDINKFWFNPHLIFNGDRMTFIREYRRKAPSLKSVGDSGPQKDCLLE